MITIRLLMLSLLVSTGIARTHAADDPLAAIPKEMRQEARKTFDAGKAYFIWVEAKQPVRGDAFLVVGSLAFVSVFYASKDKTNTMDFQIRSDIIAAKMDTKELVANYMTSKILKASSSVGKEELFVGSKDKLEGSGVAKIYAVRKDTDTKTGLKEALSNVAEVKVVFTDDAKVKKD